jgi:hypothetical protein
LYESAALHAALATSAHYQMAYYDQVEAWDCVQVSLDGAPAPPVLPTGTHTFAASFDRCTVDFLVGTWLDGTASSTYTATDLNDLTAHVSVSSMRAKLAAYRSDLGDVTADGSGTWTRVRTGTPWNTETVTYRPTIGSTLTNNRTTKVATFLGGAYTSSWGPPQPGRSAIHEEFEELGVAISVTGYTLNGSMETVHWSSSNPSSYTGEVRITRNGTLVARIYGDASGALRTEILSPLASF